MGQGQSRQNQIQASNARKDRIEKKAKRKKRNKEKLGFIGNIYFTQSSQTDEPKTMDDQKADLMPSFFLRAFTVAFIKTGREGKAFRDNVGAWNVEHLENKIEEFSGLEGFKDLIYLSFIYKKNVFETLFALRHLLNPVNYFYFASLCLEGIVSDIARAMLNKDEEPGVLFMTTHGLFQWTTSFQRFVTASACKPLYYLQKHPKFFVSLLAIYAAILNSVAYAYHPDHKDNKETLYEFYKKMAIDIVDHMIIPMLGGVHDGKYPHNMSQTDRDNTVEVLTGFLINYTALTLASMGSQMPDKVKQIWQGIKEIAHYEGPSRLDAAWESARNLPSSTYQFISAVPGSIAGGITHIWNRCCGRPQGQAEQVQRIGVNLDALGINLQGEGGQNIQALDV